MLTLNVKKTLPWILYLVFFSVLNETVFGVSTPAILAEFHLTSTEVSWMGTMFILFFGVGTIIFGRLSDLFSIRRLLSIGILVYAAGSVLGFALQGSYATVLFSRALQGIGGSALPALVTVIIARYFAPEVRGQLFGSLGSVISFGAGIGPVLGGLVTARLHWAWLFLIPVLTLIAFPFLLKVLPKEPTKPGNLDYLGAALLVFGLSSLIVWLTYPHWSFLVAGLLLVTGFVARILTAKEPFVDPKLFQIRPFRAAVITTFVLFGAFVGLNFLIPLMLHRANGLDSQGIGLVLFPGAISGVFLGPFAGRLADKRGNQLVLTVGLIFLCGSLLASPLALGQPLWVFAALLTVLFAGLTFFNTGLVNGVSRILPESEIGVGMGVFNLSGFLAGAVGAVLVGRILDAQAMTDGALLLAIGAIATVICVFYAWTVRPRLPR
ncbi:MAG: MFS transporter [Spirochaetales bacterium]